jgi:hypothetical protein
MNQGSEPVIRPAVPPEDLHRASVENRRGRLHRKRPALMKPSLVVTASMGALNFDDSVSAETRWQLRDDVES